MDKTVIFPKDETMDIRSAKGSKVRFSFPSNGRHVDQELARNLLQIGKAYTIDHIDLLSDSSKVFLEAKVYLEGKTVGFSTVLFENIKENE